MKIEETIGDLGLPVNTIAMANRLVEILKESGTNTILALRDRPDDFKAVRKILWLINQQAYGQLGNLDLNEEWHDLVMN